MIIDDQLNWYEPPVQDILEKFGVDPTRGLSPQRVLKLQQSGGKNVLDEAPRENAIQRTLRHLLDVSIIILLFAAALSLFMAFQGGKTFFEPIVILSVVILNLGLAVTQEGRAERALEALEKMASPTCTVLRDGVRLSVDTAELVPGDIIVLETGDIVPADARLIETSSLFADESALTGESEPVEKNVSAELEGTVLAGDQLNMVFFGTVITAGNGLAVVVATGMDTQMGHIAQFLKTGKRAKTPLQKRLDGLGRLISWVAIVSAFFLFALGLGRGMQVSDMLMVAIALAVAAVPEMLALIVTLTLTTSVQRMTKKHALIRKLPAVEALGNASVICSDKTGTLTMNRMALTQLWLVGGDIFSATEPFTREQEQLLIDFARASNATSKIDEYGEKRYLGDATEVGIIRLLDEKGLSELARDNDEYRRVAEIPFSSERKKMSVIFEDLKEGGYLILTKGAMEWLPIADEYADELEAARMIHDEFARRALRVLGLAGKRFDVLPDESDLEELESDLELYGLAGFIDPPRPEAAFAIEEAKRAGIRTVMITGDHAVTAKAIAEELGILEEGQSVLTGAQLADVSDRELIDKVRNYSVYARVSPEDKLRIVNAWQENDAVVAMTGDGVNDAPALKMADIGIAMGITGTEVAKGASDMILTDDNFATIVAAIKEGRNVYSIVRKTIYFLLVCNLSEVAIMLFGQIAGWGIVMSPIMLLLINIIGDGIPGLRLANEVPKPDLMERRPVKKDASFFGDGLFKHMARQIIFCTLAG
ncbi:MAG: HAD-IC family P-type ATPase, partial [Actinomycetia bacterium]|nr:HAD-IC family P-type ATPase [Actinomycetes bacterium]